MAKAPKRETEEDGCSPPEPTPFERMTELTRRIVQVPKAELPPKAVRAKPKKSASSAAIGRAPRSVPDAKRSLPEA